MFCIYGKYRYEKPLRSIVCFKSAEILESFAILEKDTRGFWVGYVCYEAFNVAESKTPLLEFVLFGVRKRQGASKKQCPTFSIQAPFFYPQLQQGFDKHAYWQAFSHIKEELSAGNTYQVNFTQELQLKSRCPALEIFQALSRRQKTPYCCYFKSAYVEILSFSPELFFKIKDDTITFEPMKGTIKRGKNPSQDTCNKRFLRKDSKSRSENLMIVDLLRNDMSQIIRLNSLRIPHFLKILRFKTLFQMVSTLKAELQTHNMGEIFRAVFPCGSVTGAPKLSTMRIIEGLEQRKRGVYCGALGVIGAKKTIFSVPIRTLSKWVHEDFYRYGVGSGVVWESHCEQEFQELGLKAEFLQPKLKFTLFETMLMYKGKIFLLHQHAQRLLRSARALGFCTDLLGFLQENAPMAVSKGLRWEDFLCLESLEELWQSASALPYLREMQGFCKVHLMLQKNGDFALKQSPLDYPSSFQVGFAKTRVHSCNDLLYHKTSLRHERRIPEGYFDVLYRNERGQVCEGARSNLVVLKDGHLLTPSMSCGLLEGTLRRVLLECGILKECVVYPEDLKGAKLYCTNALRGIVPVELV